MLAKESVREDRLLLCKLYDIPMWTSHRGSYPGSNKLVDSRSRRSDVFGQTAQGDHLAVVRRQNNIDTIFRALI